VTCLYRCPRNKELIRERNRHRNRDYQDPSPIALCATNNITYPSWCHIMKDACLTGLVLETRHAGPCQADDPAPFRKYCRTSGPADQRTTGPPDHRTTGLVVPFVPDLPTSVLYFSTFELLGSGRSLAFPNLSACRIPGAEDVVGPKNRLSDYDYRRRRRRRMMRGKVNKASFFIGGACLYYSARQAGD
jgi:hypothetical protein